MRLRDFAIYRLGALWLLILVLLAIGATGAETPKLRDLNGKSEPFKSDFAKDADKVRVVLLVSPT